MISRPAVGQNIRELERQLGVVLFTPTNKGIVPTAEANNLYSIIKNALTTLVNGENQLQAFNSDSVAVIKISSPTMLDHQIITYMKEFCKKYPKVRFEFFRESNSEKLNTGAIDFVIDIDYKFLDTNFKTIELFTINRILIASKDFLKTYNLTQNVSLEQLLQVPIITFNAGPWANFFKQHLGDAKHVIKVDASVMAFMMVQNSLGVASISQEFLREHKDPNIVVLNVKDISMPTAKMVCAYNETLSRPARVFIDGFKKFCQNLTH